MDCYVTIRHHPRNSLPSRQRWRQTPCQAPQIPRTPRTLLSDEELEMLVVLRMNREWMMFMRQHYKGAAMELFGQTVAWTVVGRA